MKWLQAVIDKIHPCLRRDCNYVNLDRMRAQSDWDEEAQRWMLPRMTVEKSKLPPAGRKPFLWMDGIPKGQTVKLIFHLGIMPGAREASYKNNGEINARVYDDFHSEDRYIQVSLCWCDLAICWCTLPILMHNIHCDSQKLQQSTEQDIANKYFKSKRTEKLLERNNQNFGRGEALQSCIIKFGCIYEYSWRQLCSSRS